jgi:predicted permease
MLRSLDRLQRVDLGFRPQGVVTTTVILPRTRYASDQVVRGFYDRVLERLDAAPDVAGAALVSTLPLGGSDTDISFRIEGRPLPATRAEEPVTWFRVVSGGYFRTLGMRVEEGRGFVETDREDQPCVVLVNRALAARYWPDAPPMGARVLAMGQRCEVVGIVNDVHHRGPADPPEPEMYFSMHQRPIRGASIVVRGRTTEAAAGAALQTVIRMEDRSLPPGTLRTMDDLLGRLTAQPRFVGLLGAGLATLAFVLALIGVHGLLSYGVSRRTREIGIRMSIGANRRDVAQLIATGSAWTILAGAGAGLAGAVGASRAIESLLFGVEPGDPFTLAVVLALVLAAGALATIVPMRRAMAVEPNVALKVD